VGLAQDIHHAFGVTAVQGQLGAQLAAKGRPVRFCLQQPRVKKLVEQVAQDKSMTRVGIVSHHESIEHGLRVMNLEPWIHFDMFAQCELRIIRVKRKNLVWDEHRRVMPSDLGGRDKY
jgi:hypothetical protein